MYSVKQFSQSDRLPTLPNVAIRLLEIAQQECPDFNEVSKIIRSDPVISGKILKTVNSALFAFSPKIESIENAIPKLGVALLRTLVLSFHLSRHKSNQKELDPVFQQHWRSSLTQAVLAEMIAEELGPKKAVPSICFLAAMLQDIGILAMISEAPEEYLQQVLKKTELPAVVPAERDHFGLSHVDVSTEIVREWGMEESFVEAIRCHHDHVAVPKASVDEQAELLKVILQAANLGATVLATTRSSNLSLDSTLQQWFEFLNVHFNFTGSQAEELISNVNLRVEQYSIQFNFDISHSDQLDEVVVKSKILLQEIALSNQMNLMVKNAGYFKRKKKSVEQDELYRDSLTGLYNRRYMNQFLNERFVRCAKNRKPITLLFLDVDQFKQINDTYGHTTGDRAIKHVADWLGRAIRKNDVAIRLGGDEFIVALESVTEANFELAARRIVDDIPTLKIEELEIEIGLSIGCAFYQPQFDDVADLNWLIDQADQAMYRAKKSGGGTVSVHLVDGTKAVCV